MKKNGNYKSKAQNKCTYERVLDLGEQIWIWLDKNKGNKDDNKVHNHSKLRI